MELSQDDAATGRVGNLYVETGLTVRRVAAGQDSVWARPFDTGLGAHVESSIPELRLGG